MVWFYETPAVVLTVPVDVVAIQELLIKENYHFVVGLAYDGATQAEWDVLTLHTLNIHDSISDSIVIDTSSVKG